MNMEQAQNFILHLKNDHIINNEKCNETISIPNSARYEETVNDEVQVEVEIDMNNIILDNTTVTNNDKRNTNEWGEPKTINLGLANDSATTEANNNSFEPDYFEYLNSSQMTSDGSLNNLILDQFTPEVKTESRTECSDRQFNETLHTEDSKEDEIPNLDDFERFMHEEMEKCDFEDVINKFEIKNACNSNGQHNEKSSHLTNTNYFIEIEGNLDNDNVSEHPNVVDDVISISSVDQLSLLDLEAISISFHEGNSNENAVNDLKNDTNEVTATDSVLNKSSEDEIHNTSPKGNINEVPNVIITRVIDENSCDSYHSSDFEFITEEEAHKDLLTININATGTFKTIETTQDSGFNDSGCSSQNSAGQSNQNHRRNINDYSEAVARYENYNFNMLNVTDRSYSLNHEVPDGDRYLELFREEFAPRVPFMIENKSTRASSTYVQYEGIGFDMRAARMSSDSDDEYADEAKESAKIILCMYPDENKRKRRRF